MDSTFIAYEFIDLRLDMMVLIVKLNSSTKPNSSSPISIFQTRRAAHGRAYCLKVY